MRVFDQMKAKVLEEYPPAPTWWLSFRVAFSSNEMEIEKQWNTENGTFTQSAVVANVNDKWYFKKWGRLSVEDT
jgi:hypothetical protein